MNVPKFQTSAVKHIWNSIFRLGKLPQLELRSFLKQFFFFFLADWWALSGVMLDDMRAGLSCKNVWFILIDNWLSDWFCWPGVATSVEFSLPNSLTKAVVKVKEIFLFRYLIFSDVNFLGSFCFVAKHSWSRDYQRNVIHKFSVCFVRLEDFMVNRNFRYFSMANIYIFVPSRRNGLESYIE